MEFTPGEKPVQVAVTVVPAPALLSEKAVQPVTAGFRENWKLLVPVEVTTPLVL